MDENNVKVVIYHNGKEVKVMEGRMFLGTVVSDIIHEDNECSACNVGVIGRGEANDFEQMLKAQIDCIAKALGGQEVAVEKKEEVQE